MPGLVRFPTLEQLHRRRSAKWTRFGPDVLPMPVAEMDCHLQADIARVLHEAVDAGDTGYPGVDPGYVDAFRGFAAERWGWQLDADQVLTCADVSVAGIQSMRALLDPGDGVIINQPVYPPFFDWPASAGMRRVDVPLLREGNRWQLDLPGIEAAFAAGARAMLLCHPHNPVGRVHPASQLAGLAEITERHHGYVISDEIHAPLTLPGNQFPPFLTVSDTARRVGVALHSASKAWNLAGLKSAFIVTAEPGLAAAFAGKRDPLLWKAGHFGGLAGQAAYQHGAGWLRELLEVLGANHRRVQERLPELVPGAVVSDAEAGYLSWIDLREAGWPGEPGDLLLEHGRLATEPGPRFGADVGAGHVRLNIGCSPNLLDEALARFAATHQHVCG
ncbi:MAG: aspartate aminotransferase [Micrococcales bacterium]|nr:MAG: aspartate aminotransferase [Micrococcales bacterium]PIE26013.1 MAG: aspartate aminotransferase [Micrococcales bacterium]